MRDAVKAVVFRAADISVGHVLAHRIKQNEVAVRPAVCFWINWADCGGFAIAQNDGLAQSRLVGIVAETFARFLNPAELTGLAGLTGLGYAILEK